MRNLRNKVQETKRTFEKIINQLIRHSFETNQSTREVNKKIENMKTIFNLASQLVKLSYID